MTDILKRNLTLVVCLLIAVISIACYYIFKADRAEELNKIYSEQQQKQDAVRAAVENKYAGQDIPEDLIQAKVNESILALTYTPEYMSLKNRANSLEAKLDNINPLQLIGYAIAGMFLITIIVSIVLYGFTKIKFTDTIIKGINGEIDNIESIALIKFMGDLFKTFGFIYAIIIGTGLIAKVF